MKQVEETSSAGILLEQCIAVEDSQTRIPDTVDESQANFISVYPLG